MGIGPSTFWLLSRPAALIEDASVGIRATRAAGAGAVIGVGERAKAAGADLVVPDLPSLRWTGDGLEVVFGPP
jgi:sugar-phosphatase